jgi:hypothetical protein
MGRRFTWDKITPPSGETRDESLLVSSDSWRASVGISRSTLNRWVKEFGLKECFLHGRKFLCRRTLREFERKVLAGAYGQTPNLQRLTAGKGG